jgi:hypothetical protein
MAMLVSDIHWTKTERAEKGSKAYSFIWRNFLQAVLYFPNAGLRVEIFIT